MLIVGAKWLNRPCRLGCSSTRTRPPVFARTYVRTTVRATPGTMPRSGTCCLVHWPIKGMRMKRIIFLLAGAPIVAYATAPSTSCPTGYIAIDEPQITIATTCPSGTTAIGTAESCLVSNPAGDCIMYAPAGVSYTDNSGTYEYTEPCPMD